MHALAIDEKAVALKRSRVSISSRNGAPRRFVWVAKQKDFRLLLQWDFLDGIDQQWQRRNKYECEALESCVLYQKCDEKKREKARGSFGHQTCLPTHSPSIIYRDICNRAGSDGDKCWHLLRHEHIYSILLDPPSKNSVTKEEKWIIYDEKNGDICPRVLPMIGWPLEQTSAYRH